MSDDVPSAYVSSPRPPLQPSPRAANTLRKLLAVAILAVAAFVCWRMVKTWFHEDHSEQLAKARAEGTASALATYARRFGATDIEDDLAKLHAAAKARLANAPKPHGLDAALDKLLDASTNKVAFDPGEFTMDKAAFGERAEDWPNYFGKTNCSDGFDDAFAEALGSDIVKMDTLKMDERVVHLAIGGRITPSGHGYQRPHSDRVFPGTRLSADIAFAGTTFHADVSPAESIEFKRVVIGYQLDGPDDGDVAVGLVQGTCKQAGLALIANLTGWTPPAPHVAGPKDLVADCDRGFHCRESADALAATSPEVAAKLYEKACDDSDDAACVLGADIAMELSKGIDDHSARAHNMLQMACMKGLPKSCAEAGRLRLRPIEPGHPVSDSQREEALVYFLRACDLGNRAACAEAVPDLAKTPYAAGAAAVARRSCETGDCPLAKQPVVTTLLGAPLGADRVFDVRWGQWSKLDDGQITAWVASASDAAPPYGKDHMVRMYAPSSVPKGIVAPASAVMVFAVTAFDPKGDNACYQCRPSGGTGVYRSMECVCVLTPNE